MKENTNYFNAVVLPKANLPCIVADLAVAALSAKLCYLWPTSP